MTRRDDKQGWSYQAPAVRSWSRLWEVLFILWGGFGFLLVLVWVFGGGIGIAALLLWIGGMVFFGVGGLLAKRGPPPSV